MIEELAALLEREHQTGAKFHRLDALTDLAIAYRVQKRYVASTIGPDQIGGYKIGLTSKRMQAMCGIDQPISGAIDRRRIVKSGAKLRFSDYHHLGLEFEICARMGRDIGPSGDPYSEGEIAAAVDRVCAAMEIVDDRNADYAVLDCASLVADNSWNAGAVLGEFHPCPSDLAGVNGVVHHNGKEIGRGRGADVLGHPFVPLTWLANGLSARGETLRKGDIVMTGSIVTTRFPSGPFTFRFEVTGLGAVEVEGE